MGFWRRKISRHWRRRGGRSDAPVTVLSVGLAAT
jgi:hypothetical protein